MVGTFIRWWARLCSERFEAIFDQVFRQVGPGTKEGQDNTKDIGTVGNASRRLRKIRKLGTVLAQQVTVDRNVRENAGAS